MCKGSEQGPGWVEVSGWLSQNVLPPVCEPLEMPKGEHEAGYVPGACDLANVQINDIWCELESPGSTHFRSLHDPSSSPCLSPDCAVRFGPRPACKTSRLLQSSV